MLIRVALSALDASCGCACYDQASRIGAADGPCARCAPTGTIGRLLARLLCAFCVRSKCPGQARVRNTRLTHVPETRACFALGRLSNGRLRPFQATLVHYMVIYKHHTQCGPLAVSLAAVTNLRLNAKHASRMRNTPSRMRNTPLRMRNTPSRIRNAPLRMRNTPSQMRNAAIAIVAALFCDVGSPIIGKYICIYSDTQQTKQGALPLIPLSTVCTQLGYLLYVYLSTGKRCRYERCAQAAASSYATAKCLVLAQPRKSNRMSESIAYSHPTAQDEDGSGGD